MLISLGFMVRVVPIFFPNRQIANFNGVIDVHIGGPLL